MTLFTMEMTDSELKNLSYGIIEWCENHLTNGVDYDWLNDKELAGEENDVLDPDLFDEYAEYLMNEEEMDDDELMTNMYAVVQYYGEEGYVFQDWYENRTTVNSADCVEYEEWKHAQQSADEFICSEEAKCTNDDDCKGCYGTDEEEWVLHPIGKFKIKKEEKCIVPDCYEYGIIEWKAMDGNVCRKCCLRINKKFEC